MFGKASGGGGRGRRVRRAIRLGLGALGLALAVVVAAVLLQADRGAVRAQGQQLVGTWTVLPRQDEQLQSPFLAVFHADGTLMTISSSPTASTGGGEWVRIADRFYALMFVQFAYDSAGQLVGVARTRATVEASPAADSLSGIYQTELIGANGLFTASSQGILGANRIILERLDR